MMLLHKILRISWLLCLGLPLASGLSLAQQPADPTPPSTPDLEAQPNTSQYPQAPRVRRRPLIPPPGNSNPYSQENNANSQSITGPQGDPGNSQANRPVMNQAQYQQPSPAATRTGATNPAPTAASPVQPAQGQGLVGPPAPIPPTPEQMPPSAPRINYQNGLLTVESSNSRLLDILNGIRHQTGIQFEGIQAATDRVAGKFGPAPPEQVLADLLQGSHFDYVMIGLPDSPESVQRVILNPSAANMSAGATAGNQPPPQTQQAASGDEDDSGSDESAEQNTVQPVPSAPAAQPEQPQQANAPKTEQQLLEELKRMQQQNQSQQNPNQPNPPPPGRSSAPIKPMSPQ